MSQTGNSKAPEGSFKKECYLCDSTAAGDLCQFWAGFKEYHDEIDYGKHVRIEQKFRDLNRYSVYVCNDCAAQLRRKKHLLGVIAWAVVIAVCGIGAITVSLTQIAGDGSGYALGTLGLFAVCGVGCIIYEIASLRSGKWSIEVTNAVLSKIRTDTAWKEKGDSFMTPVEYDALFADDYPDQPLTAEELIARAQEDD